MVDLTSMRPFPWQDLFAAEHAGLRILGQGTEVDPFMLPSSQPDDSAIGSDM